MTFTSAGGYLLTGPSQSRRLGSSSVGRKSICGVLGMARLFASKYEGLSVAKMDNGSVGPSSVYRALSTAWL